MAIQPETLDCQIKRGLESGYAIRPGQQQAARERLLLTAAAQIGLPPPPAPWKRLLTACYAAYQRWSLAQSTRDYDLQRRLAYGRHHYWLNYLMSGRMLSHPAIV
jgi:hypothetical protein